MNASHFRTRTSLTALFVGLAAWIAGSLGLAQTTPEDRIAPEPRIGFGTPNQTPWFTHPAVQQQLNWSQETHRQLASHYGNYFAQYSDSLNDLKDLSPSERRRAERDLTARFHNQLDVSLEKSLADEAERARYNQLHLQYHGVGAMTEPSVQKRLKLTPEQKQQFHKYRRQWEDALAQFFVDYPNDPKASTQRFEKTRLDLSQRFRDSLTPEQEKSWRQFTGRPFVFPAEAYLPAKLHELTAPEEKSP